MSISAVKVSIITVVYNDQDNIRNTVESVISQDYPNIEYICIDGGSTDKTFSIISEYSDKISYMHSKPDMGISDAFNQGLSKVTGNFVLVLNSGDSYLGNSVISMLMSHVEEDKIYIAKSEIYNGEALVGIFDNKVKKLTTNMSVSHSATLIPARLLREFDGYSMSKKIAMDYDLLLKIYKKYGLSVFKPVDLKLTTYSLGGVSDKNFYIGFWESYKSKSDILGDRFIGLFIFALLYVKHFFYQMKIKSQE